MPVIKAASPISQESSCKTLQHTFMLIILPESGNLQTQDAEHWTLGGPHINLLRGVDDVKQVPLCQVTMETELSLAQPVFSVEYLSFSSFRSRDLLSGDKLRLCTSTQPYVSFSEIRKLVWKQLLLCRQL